MRTTRKKHITFAQLILGTLLGLYAFVCLMPLVLCVIVSFSSDASIRTKGFSFFPEEWSLQAWSYVGSFGNQLLTSYGVTILITVVGTILGLIVMGTFAYALSRQQFQLRKAFSIVMLIPMLFSGGKLAGYLVNTQLYHLKNSIWVLILPGISTMYIIILRTYIQMNIPDSLMESAKIDGAGEIRTFAQIVLPTMVPAMASVGFMLAVGYWNDWNRAFLYITSASKTPLQLLLIRIEKNIEFLLQEATMSSGLDYTELKASLPEESGRMAIMLTVLGPILIAYPFFQNYFIQGLTVGSVKG